MWQPRLHVFANDRPEIRLEDGFFNGLDRGFPILFLFLTLSTDSKKIVILEAYTNLCSTVIYKGNSYTAYKLGVPWCFAYFVIL